MSILAPYAGITGDHWGGAWEAPFSVPISGTVYDTDALAYITAVKAAGASLTTDQETAIHLFFDTGKNAGWFDKIVDLWIWTYAVAGANAISVNLDVGTFSGAGWNHAAGYAEGNGVTDTFLTGIIPSAEASVSVDNVALTAYLAEVETSNTGVMGAYTTADQDRLSLQWFAGKGVYSFGTYSATRVEYIPDEVAGLFLMNRPAADYAQIHRKSSSVYEYGPQDHSRLVASAGSLPDIEIIVSAENRDGTNSLVAGTKFSLAGVMQGLSDAEAVSYMNSAYAMLGVLGAPEI